MRTPAAGLLLLASCFTSPLPPPEVPPGPPASRVELALDTVVALTNPETGRTYCSGVFIADGYILTAGHCVDDEDGNPRPEIQVRTRAEGFTTGAPFMTRVVSFQYSDDGADLAVLSPSEVIPTHPEARLSPEDPAPGDPVVVVGHPYGLTWTITSGVATGVRSFAGLPYLQVSAPASPGNSGGPVFNEFGEVVGIVVLQFRDPHLIFATPLATIRAALER